jgi:hypothetical protein
MLSEQICMLCGDQIENFRFTPSAQAIPLSGFEQSGSQVNGMVEKERCIHARIQRKQQSPRPEARQMNRDDGQFALNPWSRVERRQ